MRRSIAPIISALFLISTAWAAERTISDIHVSLDEWEFVPTLNGTRVESFVALRDPEEVVGDNVTAIWFLRIEDSTWKTYAWHDQDNLKAIAHVKSTLGLDDSTDANWPLAEAQQGVDVNEASEPDQFGTGVFEEDPLAPTIESLPEPGALIESLEDSGWSAASISIWSEVSECTQDQILSTLAAMVEADIATDADGAVVAGFTVPQTTCDEWLSLTTALQPDGTWTVPDLVPYFEATTSVNPGDGWQSVPLGTAFTGPQTIVVDGGGIDGGGQQVVSAHLVITTRDVSKPSVTIQLESSEQPFMSPGGGHPYFVAPAVVTAEVAAFDAVDATPIVTAWHNGAPYVAGTEITGLGIHTIAVLATDSAGNQNWTTHLFEIRRRRNFGAEVHVADIATMEGVGGIEQVAVTVRITASEFDVKTLNPGTIDLWLADEDGTWVEATADSTDLIEYEDCYYVFAFSEDFTGAPLSSLPAGLVLTGRGLTSTPSEYDFIATASAEISPGPFEPPCDDPGEPDPPGPAPCQWVTQPCTATAQSCVWANFTPWSASVMGMWVTCTSVTGSGYCWVSINVPASVYSNCSKTNGGTINVFLSGDDCCNDCTINVVASPAVSGSVLIDPLGSATVNSTIAVGVGGTGASASGSVSLTNDEGGTITENGFSIPIGPGQASGSYAAVAQPPLNQNFQTCSLSVTIATAGTINTSASTTFFNWYGSADGSFGIGTPGLTITPQTNCVEDELEDVIVVDYVQ